MVYSDVKVAAMLVDWDRSERLHAYQNHILPPASMYTVEATSGPPSWYAQPVL